MNVPAMKKNIGLFKASVDSPFSPYVDIIFFGKTENISPRPILFYNKNGVKHI